jgi:hypothetical protein
LTADRDKVEAELEKQWGYNVTRAADGSLVLGVSTGLGKVDKEIIAIVHSMDSQDQELALKERQVADQELTSAKQRLDIDVGIEVKEQQIVSAKLEDNLKQTKVNDELLTSAKQRLDIDKGVELKEVQKLQVVAETANVPKQGALIDAQKDVQVQQKASQILEDSLKSQETADKLLTSVKQRDDIVKGIEVKEMQRKNLYVEMVGKDKETAKMGLDNVVKNAEAARATNPTIIYTPKYGVI